MMKKYKYMNSFSEEMPCIGGNGSKPAFDLLKHMRPDVIVKRDHSMSQGHVGFAIYAINKTKMREALNTLHEQYNWIDGDDADTCQEIEVELKV
jgi:hypothetical protein